MTTADALPRVTYTNVDADFGPVHAALDAALAEAPARWLGRSWTHRIGGKPDERGAAHDVASPIDHELHLGRFLIADAATVDDAVRAARRAQPAWQALGWQGRCKLLRACADALSERRVALAAACLLEVGKSRLEAMGEVEESVDMLRYYCDQLETERGFERPMHRAFPSEATTTVLRPHGVFGVIAPFNFPVALSVGMLAGALLGGNTVVYKPGPNSGLTASLLVDALTAGGLPADALQLVLGDGDTGRALAAHPGIDGVVFTGSHRAGMDILRACAQRPHAIPVIAEMGGKNPAYVTASADLERAAAGVARSAFGLQGQKCSACSVVFVHDSVAAQFTERLLERTRQLPLGDPRRRDVFVGPLVDAAAAGRYEAAIASARADGRVLCGGRFERSGPLARGAYAEPAIVAGLPDGHSLHTDELFLPLLAIRRFSRLDEAIAGGNAVRYGLTAGIYSRDDGEVQAFLEQAQAGVLYANRASGATTGAWPGIQSFCGWKGSGTTSKGGLGTWYLPQFMREQSRTLWHDAG